MKFNIQATVARTVLTLAIAAIAGQALAQNPQPRDKVIAKNSRVTITYADFEAELARITQDERFEVLLSREKTAVLLDNMLVNKTLALEAREKKLDAEPHIQAEIANQTDKVLAKYRGQQYQATLPKVDLLPRAREQFLTNPDKFSKPELHDFWHVLISMKGRTPEQAMARAIEVKTKYTAGTPPEQLALEYSDDQSKVMNKGVIGPYNIAGFDPSFRTAIRALKVGDITIAESPFGLHVVKLLGITPGARDTFESAKPILLKDAETAYIVSSWNNYLRTITNDPKLFVDVETLDAIRPKMPDVMPPPVFPAPAGVTAAPAPATTLAPVASPATKPAAASTTAAPAKTPAKRPASKTATDPAPKK